MKTKILVIVSMLVIVALSWMPSASADMEGTKTINEDEYWVVKSSFFSGDYLKLSYTIDVQNDQWIDVMLLNEENYNKYENDQPFSIYDAGTDLVTLYKKVSSITFYEHDNYYLVVDNTDVPTEGAQPTGYCTFYYVSSAKVHSNPSGGGSSTTWEDDEEDFDLLGILCISFVVIGLIVSVMVGVILYDKQKKQKAQQSQQPYQQPSPQQPPQPYYQDQQPPPPPDYQPPQPPY